MPNKKHNKVYGSCTKYSKMPRKKKSKVHKKTKDMKTQPINKIYHGLGTLIYIHPNPQQKITKKNGFRTLINNFFGFECSSVPLLPQRPKHTQWDNPPNLLLLFPKKNHVIAKGFLLMNLTSPIQS